MSCLIPEILFAIGKKVIEDGDSNAVIQFTLSGKESLKAMKNVFASVTSLELYQDGYAIGWSNGCTNFKLQNDEQLSKFLMDQIGTRVETLHLDIDGINRMYQIVLDKIIANPRVSTLSVGSRCSRFLLDKFYLSVSSSLKNVTIPSSIMHNVFRDSLNLDSLIVLDSNGFDHLSFCCRTKSLELWHFREDAFGIFFTLDEAIATVALTSPHLSTVKRLTFNSTTDYFLPDIVFYAIKNHFPALEVIQYNQELSESDWLSPEETIFYLIKYFLKIILLNAATPPQKYACKFYTNEKYLKYPSCDTCKKFLDRTGFYDETNQKVDDDSMKDFHCFRLNFPSDFDETRTTIFEIQIA